ncbi:hypothetical protein EFS61_00080 [Lactobacillus hominis]|nr:hypothetical protein [Lactobacillus hominis]
MTRRNAIILVIVAVVSFIFLLITMFFPSGSNNNSNKDSSSYQSSQQSSSSEDNEDIKKANEQLVKDLKGNQDDANNGDHNYDYSTYIEKIEIKSNTQAHVYVDESFMNLDDDAKTKVGNSVSNLILRSMTTSGMDIQPEDQKRGIYLAFYTSSDKAIGHSRLSNYLTYKFY